jgi:hypothetical protein
MFGNFNQKALRNILMNIQVKNYALFLNLRYAIFKSS